MELQLNVVIEFKGSETDWDMYLRCKQILRVVYQILLDTAYSV